MVKYFMNIKKIRLDLENSKHQRFPVFCKKSSPGTLIAVCLSLLEIVNILAT